jgi:hypothetical protein
MKKFLLVTLICILLCLGLTTIASADEPLDLIRNYTIQVDPRVDGTLDITYGIEWEVLSDKNRSEPVTWVEIGVPNDKYEIELQTKSCVASKYNKNGSLVRLDLDRPYYKGEIIVMGFKIHQSNMYVREADKHLCRYSFTPGWFNEIEVKSVHICWNAKNVIESSSTLTQDINGQQYYVWSASLKPGERINASVSYNLDVFDTSDSGAWNGDARESSGGSLGIGTILLIILAIFLVILFFMYITDGFSGGGGGGIFIHSGGGCAGCACAGCACACACAGGGRAGCAKKDFYPGAQLSMEQFEKIAKPEKKT